MSHLCQGVRSRCLQAKIAQVVHIQVPLKTVFFVLAATHNQMPSYEEDTMRY